MRLWILSRHLPDREGTAAGRILFATHEGLVAEGHEVEVSAWGPEEPGVDLPSWCSWREVPLESGPYAHLRSILHPRTDVLRSGWTPPEGVIAIADDPLSFPAVAAAERSVVTVHYSTKLDAASLRRHRLKDVQDRRAEARAARGAALVLSYSRRVIGALPGAASFVPAAYPVPDQPVPAIDRPIAAVLADWRWPPNQAALRLLLGLWPSVRRRVHGAELYIAGRGCEPMSSGDGVRSLGEVRRSADVLSSAAVLAFPAPSSSGPKVKVLEALAHGLPVVTTPSGIEGLVLPAQEGVLLSAPGPAFAEALASLMNDPERRSLMGREGRAAIERSHAPVPAARARMAILNATFPHGAQDMP